MREKGIENPGLDISVRVAILHTIAKSIYPSTSRKIREAVANSLDNNATWFILYADREARTLSLYDNGHGITKDRFNEIFNNLGYGLLKYDDKLSYFGLGLISIFQLGERAKIFTRAYNQDEILYLDVKASAIFDVNNESLPIDFLKKCISLSNEGDIKRISSPAPIIDDKIINIFGNMPKSFTEIIIENVNAHDFEEMTNPNFENELRQLLPISPEENDPFLLKIKDPKKLAELHNIFSNRSYFPTMEVYFGIKDERQLTKLYKYFPEFKTELEFKEADIEVGISKSNNFAYYIVHTTQDLERSEKEGSETGFWVRNQNFLLKSADFFEKPGSRKRYIHEPLKNWMYGEIYHKNMNEFITVARNDYIWDSKGFEDFKAEVIDLIVDLNTTLRKAWRQKNEVIGAIIKPFEEISEVKGPFLRCNKTLEAMGVKSDGPDADTIFNKLQSKRKQELEDDTKRVDILLMDAKTPITLTDDEDILIQIDASISDSMKYQDSWDPELKRTVVLISPTIFYPKDVVFLGKTFEIFFIIDNETAPAVSINSDTCKIYINPFNIDLINYTISFLDILIAIEVADSMTITKDEMKSYLIKLFGWTKNLPSVSDYFGPLADDLMRRRLSRK